MIKLVIVSVLAVMLLGGIGAGGYYVYQQTHPTDDHSIIVVDTSVGKPVPPPFSVTGKVYEVPGMGGVTTTINALFPSSRRDYPMGRFTSSDGVVEGKLVVIDEFVSPYFNNRRAVPFAVEQGGSGTFYYLAVLEGDDLRYVTSVPVGDRIKITSISRKDDNVTLSYLVHDKNQPMSDVPTIGTDAVVNIATGVMVQAGRNPQTEASVADKFTGRYFWVRTEYADGKVVKPDSLEYFTLGFSGESVTLETDCNTGGAPLTLGAGSSTVFIVGAVDATKKTCSSQYEVEYFAMFGKVATYAVSPGGKLTLAFADGGTMQFISATEKEASLNPVATTTATTTATVTP